MCNPAAIAGAQFAAQSYSQGANARKQAEYNAEIFALNKESAEKNAILSYTQLQRRQEEEGARAAQSIEMARRQALVATGAQTTAMAESGVAGNTAAALTADFARREAEYTQTIIRNQAFLNDQFKLETDAVAIRERAQIISGSNPAPLGADWINGGIRAAADFLRMNWNQQNNQNPYG